MLNTNQIAAIPETVQNTGLIPLAKWNDYYAYPSSYYSYVRKNLY